MKVREQHRDGAPRVEGNIQTEGVAKNSEATLNRNLYVVCFNSGEMGHLSSGCNDLRFVSIVGLQTMLWSSVLNGSNHQWLLSIMEVLV